MVAALAKEADLLVDAGDAIQGGVIGTLSKGEYIVDIMNEIGYDVAIPGNHEFDYDMDQFLKLPQGKKPSPNNARHDMTATSKKISAPAPPERKARKDSEKCGSSRKMWIPAPGAGKRIKCFGIVKSHMHIIA